MKTTIIFSTLALVLTFSACNSSSNNSSNNTEATQSLDTTKLAKGTVFYQCPMHPEVTSDKAGSCSKCGMDLEKVEKK